MRFRGCAAGCWRRHGWRRGWTPAPIATSFFAADPLWASPDTRAVIKRNGASWTPYYLLTAVDLRQAPSGGLERVAPDQAIFLGVLGRT